MVSFIFSNNFYDIICIFYIFIFVDGERHADAREISKFKWADMFWAFGT